MKEKNKKYKDNFTLYNLKVSITGDKSNFVCSHKLGFCFKVIGENIKLNKSTTVSLYALSSLLPLLPAKQRFTNKNDWITTDDEVACPDPNCSARFKIERIAKKIFRHSKTTVTPL